MDDLQAMIARFGYDVRVLAVYLDVTPQTRARGSWKVGEVLHVGWVRDVDEGRAIGTSENGNLTAGFVVDPTPAVISVVPSTEDA